MSRTRTATLVPPSLHLPCCWGVCNGDHISQPDLHSSQRPLGGGRRAAPALLTPASSPLPAPPPSLSPAAVENATAAVPQPCTRLSDLLEGATLLGDATTLALSDPIYTTGLDPAVDSVCAVPLRCPLACRPAACLPGAAAFGAAATARPADTTTHHIAPPPHINHRPPPHSLGLLTPAPFLVQTQVATSLSEVLRAVKIVLEGSDPAQPPDWSSGEGGGESRGGAEVGGWGARVLRCSVPSSKHAGLGA